MDNNSIQDLIQVLKEMTIETTNRISIIEEEELVSFVERRQEIVHAMEKYRNFLTEEDKQEIGYILDMDEPILDRMNKLKDEAGSWMEKKGNIRIQQNAYQRAYSVDSLFIDHRK
ncbi:hypothetical protein G7L40_10925 [Paenibacillus polymyxa]|uniref:Flagellar protein FliT n=1 Tax=Paenibacillus polymyxa TaxID=1406 RepID=A0A378Y5S0_PAEPO|nr:hypothetical protein [Paenibacillus polymyxa]MBE7898980.1 hypothetical protein [Paenibacillus polymyxa]MBG9763708.1 hypothetical protein [Paenibacillus polymyxa]MCC3259789.1 hypothetical protein [Paenibacillus polymyxa]QPK56127.1 hypothetical protein G7035_10945 [Paenibacillus polymyxa]QPK58251.1 hypothetical protein G7L40_10925 [Paenibacillus polymyxa]